MKGTERHYGCNGMAGREYSADDAEFIKAMEDYMRRTGRKFPLFTEVLAVARSLGYRKAPKE